MNETIGTQAAHIQNEKERIQVLLDAAPLACRLMRRVRNGKFEVFECNEESVKLFHFKDKQEFIERYFEIYPEYQPDGSNSIETVQKHMEKAYAEGRCHTNFVFQTKDGVLIPAELTLHRVKLENEDVIASYSRDMREQKRMMNVIKKRDNLFDTINRVAVVLLTAANEENFEKSLLEGMDLIGLCMEADCVQIWPNEIRNDTLHFVLRHTWLSDTRRQTPSDAIGTALPYPERWKALFLRGECLNGPISELPQEDQELLAPLGLKSTITIPIFYQDTFWGVFCVDDYVRERRFEEDEINILRSAALMLANAINRNEQSAQIHEAHRRTRLMLDATPLAVSLLDKDMRLFDCNAEALRLFKVEDKQKYLANFSDLSPEYQPDGSLTSEKFVAVINKTAESDVYTLEWMHQTLDGEPMPTEVTLVRVPYKDDYAIAGYVRDLREYKKMMQDIHEASVQLEAALHIAQEANQEKTKFLAAMSHEIRTPMNSIVGFSELALDDAISSKTRDYLGKILENSNWLLQIINDILDISKIESGKMELETIPIDLHELFANCRSMIMPKALEKGLALHFYAEPSVGKVPLGDPTRLRQVLANILANAVKFTNSGIVKVRSVIKNMGENTATIYFEVKDSGIGMTPEQAEKIFNPFMQAESGTTRKYGGTGLGLPIAKNLVEMMGGSIVVESAPGIGSKFSFELTFDTIDVDQKDLLEKNIMLDGMEKPVFEGEVLLCEDNAMNQQVISEHLARVGLRVVVAENGKIGVERVRERMLKGEKQFDLIFMDIHMPVMDGLDASAEILSFNIHVPIVALTANVMVNDRELYRKSGMMDYVGKPFTSQELWRCLMKYFTPARWQPVNSVQQAHAESELRQKLISNFVKHNRNLFREISDAVNAGDVKLAHRLAHTLKSNAGQLGMAELQKVAEHMEDLLKDGISPAALALMSLLETELNTVLENLAPLADSPVSPQPAPQAEALDVEQARELFATLEPLLEVGNPECLHCIDSLRSVPGSEELIGFMEDMEFERASAALARLQESIPKRMI